MTAPAYGADVSNSGTVGNTDGKLTAYAAAWNRFCGPNGSGVAAACELPLTWTAYEQVGITGSPLRTGSQADYCVPAQLVAPRLAAWLWKKDRPRGDARAGWVKYPDNPVLPATRTDKLGGTVNDPYVLKKGATFCMWHTWWNGNPTRCLSLVESKDGVHWSAPQPVLEPNTATDWECAIDRARLLKKDGRYHLWYTAANKGNRRYVIGNATSPDGKTWKRMSDRPVLEPDRPWESVCVMSPSAIWDQQAKLFRMWYSGGGFHNSVEPDAIGYATSADGLTWSKHPDNPVLRKNSAADCEKHKVAGGQVQRLGEWYVMFYIGFRDTPNGQTCIARSKDGIHWQRHPQNPILSPTPNGFDRRSLYTPCAVLDNGKWFLWYNGASTWPESIGLATHEGADLGFDDVPAK